MSGKFGNAQRNDPKKRFEIELKGALEAASKDFLSFCLLINPNFVIGPHHKLIADALMRLWSGKNKSGRLMIFMPPRSGKELAHTTPVWTPSGWRKHGDLKPGDYVYHPSGTQIKVLAESEEHLDDVEMTFSNGEKIICHENHEWNFYCHGTGEYKTYEAKYFLTPTKFNKLPQLTSGPIGQRSGRYMYHLPTTDALQGTELELPLHPYALGLWLGDGSSGGPYITHHKEEIACISYVEQLGYPVTNTIINKQYPSVARSCFGNGRGTEHSKFASALYSLDVKNNKHIPEDYLRASIAQRLQLLAGLIDSDGHIDKSNSRLFITTCDSRLRDDICTLLRSLGQKPSVFTEEPKLSTSGIQGKKDTYIIGFSPTIDIPCILERKRPFRFPKQRRISLVSVRRLEKGEPGKCIQVDSPDGLYLVGKTMIPTHNSFITSQYFPAWCIGKRPNMQTINLTHKTDLATDFSREVRNIVGSPSFDMIFPGVGVRADSRAADRWHTSKGGVYIAAGTTSKVAGRGANLLLIDDPLSEQDAFSKKQRDNINNLYQSGYRSRVFPDAKIIICNTRWHEDDLSGRLLRQSKENPQADKWEVLTIPAILETQEEVDALNKAREQLIKAGVIGKNYGVFKIGTSYWPPNTIYSTPDRKEETQAILTGWTTESLLTTKANMLPHEWEALYMQRPSSPEGNIFKSSHWQDWTQKKPPSCEYVVMSMDTAYSEKESADYSAITTWGIFRDEFEVAHLCLLGADKGRWAYPDLRRRTRELYDFHKPDAILVEKKSSGQSLIADLRIAGIPVLEYTPDKDKISRAYSCTPLFEAGRIWAPKIKSWANDVIYECAVFPSGEHDDYVDTVSQVILWVKNGMLLSHPDDYFEREEIDTPSRKVGYF